MIVDMDWVREVKNKLAEINNCDIENLVWMENGKEVEFEAIDIEQWIYTGLNNLDIINNMSYTQKK